MSSRGSATTDSIGKVTDKTPPSVRIWVCPTCGRWEPGPWAQRGRHWFAGQPCEAKDKPQPHTYIYLGPSE